jgi:hypothetical protein
MGEMEVWAIYGYGAAFNLHEMMTVKSDNIDGRVEMFEKIVRDGHYHMSEGSPTEAFNVLTNELKGLCLDVELLKEDEVAVIRADEKMRLGTRPVGKDRGPIIQKKVSLVKARRQKIDDEFPDEDCVTE